MYNNTPRTYSDTEVREFLTQAIETETNAVRRDLDLTDEYVEYVLDIAAYVEATWLSQREALKTA